MTVKVYILDKSNNVSKVKIFKKFFQCVMQKLANNFMMNNLIF